ncbi:uncharacterized protein LOC115228734 [Octopus sinensis]|uniref:2-oxoisovalerate dehydrogenase subunit alpha n=1 Tax=Octopus sinensis TaxID=2607531 RepID=A0A6P7TYV6_9MOLL|nr:uncharacterized protein LOC115228734 [Octopus sinensis]
MNLTASNIKDHAIGRQQNPMYYSKKLKIFNNSPPLGTQIPQAVGQAYVKKIFEEQDSCVVVFFGEGAASEGDAFTGLNFAATLKSPVVFICRNNEYAISTHSDEQYSGDGIVSIRMSEIPLKQYLEKYMSKSDTKIPKKRKVNTKRQKYMIIHSYNRLTIHDDDEIVPPAFQNEIFQQSDDDEPQIVEIPDNFPSNHSNPNKWKSLKLDSEMFAPLNIPPDTKVENSEITDSNTEKKKKRRFEDDNDMSPVRRVKEEINEDPPTHVIFRDRKTLKKRDQAVENAKNVEKQKREEEIKAKYSLWELG